MASWVPIVVIIFALALVVGPVMWLKPSDRDRRLASFRQQAASKGMTVQMQPLPPALGEGNAAVYFSRWQNPRRLQTGWGLELRRMAHEMHFSELWDWRNGRKAPTEAEAPLRKLLGKLPDDASAIVCNDIGLGVQWRESSGDKGIAELLEGLAELRPVIEEAIRQPQRQQDNPA